MYGLYDMMLAGAVGLNAAGAKRGSAALPSKEAGDVMVIECQTDKCG